MLSAWNKFNEKKGGTPADNVSEGGYAGMSAGSAADEGDFQKI